MRLLPSTTGMQETLYLGNLDAKRDWGHARDYVRGMWLMLPAGPPGRLRVRQGQCYAVAEFVECAFAEIGITVEWRGEGSGEKGYDAASGRVLVEIDPRYFRPTEVQILVGDASKARKEPGWRHETSFQELVTEMVREDLRWVAQEAEVRCREYGVARPALAVVHANDRLSG